MTTAHQDAKKFVVLLWLSVLFFGLVPVLMVALLRPQDPFINAHKREALNWCVTATIGYVLAAVLMWLSWGGWLALFVTIAHVVVCLQAARAAYDGRPYQALWSIRVLK